MKYYFAMAAALLVLCDSAANATPTLDPSGPWVIDYGERACMLSRSFGSVENALKINFSRALNPLLTDISIEGEGAERLQLSRVDIIEFWTLDVAFSARLVSGLSRVSVEPYTIAGQVLTLASAQHTPGITELRLSQRGRGSHANLMVGDLTGPLAALQRCQDNLYRTLDIDIAAMRAITVQSMPVGNQASWVTTDDLPRNIRPEQLPSTVIMLLNIDIDGRVTRCTVTTPSAVPILNIQSCRVMTARARFSPALNAAGEAVPSVFEKRIRWQGLS